MAGTLTNGVWFGTITMSECHVGLADWVIICISCFMPLCTRSHKTLRLLKSHNKTTHEDLHRWMRSSICRPNFLFIQDFHLIRSARGSMRSFFEYCEVGYKKEDFRR